MKISVINFGVPNFDEELDAVAGVAALALKELNESDADVIRVFDLKLPPNEGVRLKAMDGIMKRVSQADGVIIAVPSSSGLPGSLFCLFFEHLRNADYPGVLSGKNCFVLAVGDAPRNCADAVSSVLARFGAFDAVRLALFAETAAAAQTDDANAVRECVERLAEDFYRVLRQNRRFFIQEPTAAQTNVSAAADAAMLSDAEYERLLGKIPRKTANQLYEERKADLPDEPDTEELVKVFVEKFSRIDNATLDLIGSEPSPIARPLDKGAMKPAPRVKTVKQMTFSLPHRFKPQLAQGLNAIIHFSVTGAEAFDCHLTISNTDCDIQDGEPPVKDLTLLADSAILADILKGKYTSQKAFMTGHLKVRGNFMILTKFDQLFDFNII